MTDLLHLFRRDAQRPDEPTDVRTRELPADLWVRCDQCRELLYVKDFERALKVCGRCGHHARLGARERLDQLWIVATTRKRMPGCAPPTRWSSPAAGQRYQDKLIETQDKTGYRKPRSAGPASLKRRRPAGRGRLQLHGRQHGLGGRREGRAGRSSTRWRIASRSLAVCSSGGARMHEGIFSLMQMAKTVGRAGQLGDARRAVLLPADRSDHRRRDRQLRGPGRRDAGRAGRAGRVRRAARHRADHQAEAAAGHPARRVPARARHDRQGRAPPRPAPDPRPPLEAVHGSAAPAWKGA